MAVELVESLSRIGTCLASTPGRPCFSRKTVDHLIPQAIPRRLLLFARGEGLPESISYPAEPVVKLHSNLFVYCQDHHRKQDFNKMRAFLGDSPEDDNPVGLFNFFLEGGMPITTHKRHRTDHIRLTMVTIDEYIAAAELLSEVLPARMARRYERSVSKAEEWKVILQQMKRGSVDLVAA